MERFDAVVIGAGFGGIGAALALAEQGARVALCETLNYPGGCASTFTRKGHSFESGATLFSGLGPSQLFGQWIAKHRLDVEVEILEPAVRLRAPSLQLDVSTQRESLVAAFCAMPGAPRAALAAFFAEQARCAAALWSLFDAPELLPPLDLAALVKHAARSPRYLPLLRHLGRPLGAMVARHGLSGFTPLCTYLDAVCQITVQCPYTQAEAPFALGAMDYYFHGTGHVRGGVGVLARELVRAFEAIGGEVLLANRVKSLRRDGALWRVDTRRGELRARSVVANVLPQALRTLLGWSLGEDARLDRLATRVEGGWGAAMLYRVVRAPAGAPTSASHYELVADPTRPFTHGNHVFMSLSGAGERERDGLRTATISTHVPLGLGGDDVARVQATMRQTIAQLAPEWGDVTFEETASPRTFERFTGRPGGAVGGIPRRAGLSHYDELGPKPVRDGLYLVGDSVFPGQSTLAAALGGVRLAARLQRDR